MGRQLHLRAVPGPLTSHHLLRIRHEKSGPCSRLTTLTSRCQRWLRQGGSFVAFFVGVSTLVLVFVERIDLFVCMCLIVLERCFTWHVEEMINDESLVWYFWRRRVLVCGFGTTLGLVIPRQSGVELGVCELQKIFAFTGYGFSCGLFDGFHGAILAGFCSCSIMS